MEKFKCIICEKTIESLYMGDPETPEQGAWNGGVVEKLYMPYGSKFDEDVYIFAICDDCVEEKHKKGLIGKKIKKEYEN